MTSKRVAPALVRSGTGAVPIRTRAEAVLAAHDRAAPDELFRKRLPLIEKAAKDERNFVKKGILWALRAVGERSPALHAEALAMSRRLAASTDGTARWVGTAAARELTSKAATKRLAAKRKGLAKR